LNLRSRAACFVAQHDCDPHRHRPGSSPTIPAKVFVVPLRPLRQSTVHPTRNLSSIATSRAFLIAKCSARNILSRSSPCRPSIASRFHSSPALLLAAMVGHKKNRPQQNNATNIFPCLTSFPRLSPPVPRTYCVVCRVEETREPSCCHTKQPAKMRCRTLFESQRARCSALKAR
jgi:hypothetical protein